MNAVATANEYKNTIGPDFSLADAYDAEYLEGEYRPVDVDLMSVSERQALNARMADWFNG